MKVFFEEINEFSFSENINVVVEYLIIEEGSKEGNLNIIFCSDNYLLKMNKEYLGHNYFTDVITFDYSEENLISGDVFISVDTVKENAKNYEVSFENELFRVIIHGVLHLIGYNDKTDKEQEEMTIKENYYLDKLI